MLLNKFMIVKVALAVSLVVIAVSVVVYMSVSIESGMTEVLSDYLSLVDRTTIGNSKDKFYEDFYDAYYNNADVTSEDSPDSVRNKGGGGDKRKNGTLGYKTKKEAEAALNAAASRNNKQPAAWKVVGVNGRFFVVENQSSKWWGDVVSGSGSSMSSAGCMWFAISAMLSAKSDNVVTVSQLLKAVGYSVSYNSAGKYSVSEKLPCVGNDSGKKYANGAACTPSGIANSYNGRTLMDSGKPNRTNLTKGSVYLVHAQGDSKRIVSMTGEHWFVITGYDSSSKAYQLLNCKVTACNADEVDRLLNHAYEY